MNLKDAKHKVGDDIYVGSSYHLSRGSADVAGGLCKITKLSADKNCPGYVWVEVKEHPGHSYNYEHLLEQQSSKKEYGKRRGVACPDEDRPWIEPGDSVTKTIFDKDGTPRTQKYKATKPEW